MFFGSLDSYNWCMMTWYGHLGKGSYGNSIPHLDMPPRRSSGGTIHGSVRPRTTVPTRSALARASSPSAGQGPMRIA